MSTAPTTFRELKVKKEDRIKLTLTCEMVKSALLKVQACGRRTTCDKIANELARKFPTAYGWMHYTCEKPQQSGGVSRFHAKVSSTLQDYSCFFSVKSPGGVPSVDWHCDLLISHKHRRHFDNKGHPRHLFVDEWDVEPFVIKSFGIGDCMHVSEPEDAGLSDIEKECDAQVSYYRERVHRRENRDGMAEATYTRLDRIPGLTMMSERQQRHRALVHQDTSDAEDGVLRGIQLKTVTNAFFSGSYLKRHGCGLCEHRCKRCGDQADLPDYPDGAIPTSYTQLKSCCLHMRAPYSIRLLAFVSMCERGESTVQINDLRENMATRFKYHAEQDQDELILEIFEGLARTGYTIRKLFDTGKTRVTLEAPGFVDSGATTDLILAIKMSKQERPVDGSSSPASRAREEWESSEGEDEDSQIEPTKTLPYRAISSTCAQRVKWWKHVGGKLGTAHEACEKQEIIKCSTCNKYTIAPGLTLADLKDLPTGLYKLARCCTHVPPPYDMEVLLYAALQQSKKQNCPTQVLSTAIRNKCLYFVQQEAKSFMRDLILIAQKSPYFETADFNPRKIPSHLISLASQDRQRSESTLSNDQAVVASEPIHIVSKRKRTDSDARSNHEQAVRPHVLSQPCLEDNVKQRDPVPSVPSSSPSSSSAVVVAATRSAIPRQQLVVSLQASSSPALRMDASTSREARSITPAVVKVESGESELGDTPPREMPTLPTNSEQLEQSSIKRTSSLSSELEKRPAKRGDGLKVWNEVYRTTGQCALKKSVQRSRAQLQELQERRDAGLVPPKASEKTVKRSMERSSRTLRSAVLDNHGSGSDVDGNSQEEEEEEPITVVTKKRKRADSTSDNARSAEPEVQSGPTQKSKGKQRARLSTPPSSPAFVVAASRSTAPRRQAGMKRSPRKGVSLLSSPRAGDLLKPSDDISGNSTALRHGIASNNNDINHERLAEIEMEKEKERKRAEAATKKLEEEKAVLRSKYDQQVQELEKLRKLLLATQASQAGDAVDMSKLESLRSREAQEYSSSQAASSAAVLEDIEASRASSPAFEVAASRSTAPTRQALPSLQASSSPAMRNDASGSQMARSVSPVMMELETNGSEIEDTPHRELDPQRQLDSSDSVPADASTNRVSAGDGATDVGIAQDDSLSPTPLAHENSRSPSASEAGMELDFPNAGNGREPETKRYNSASFPIRQSPSGVSSPPSLSFSSGDTDMDSLHPTSDFDAISVTSSSEPVENASLQSTEAGSSKERDALAPMRGAGAKRRIRKEKARVPRCIHGIPRIADKGVPDCMVCGLADIFKL